MIQNHNLAPTYSDQHPLRRALTVGTAILALATGGCGAGTEQKITSCSTQAIPNAEGRPYAFQGDYEGNPDTNKLHVSLTVRPDSPGKPSITSNTIKSPNGTIRFVDVKTSDFFPGDRGKAFVRLQEGGPLGPATDCAEVSYENPATK